VASAARTSALPSLHHWHQTTVVPWRPSRQLFVPYIAVTSNLTHGAHLGYHRNSRFAIIECRAAFTSRSTIIQTHAPRLPKVAFGALAPSGVRLAATSFQGLVGRCDASARAWCSRMRHDGPLMLTTTALCKMRSKMAEVLLY